MSDYIRILEVEGTNLLYVIKSRNTNATYYNKENLEVEGRGGNVVLKNEGVEVLNNSPFEFITPKEDSLKDIVEIIQGYINNIIPVVDETVIALEEIIVQNEARNELLEAINVNTFTLRDLLEEQKLTNVWLREILR